jgi:carboxypeptidase C (cathepsin A)
LRLPVRVSLPFIVSPRMRMRFLLPTVLTLLALSASTATLLAQGASSSSGAVDKSGKNEPIGMTATPPDSTTTGTIEAGGEHLTYTAVIGTLPVGATNAEDAMLAPDGKMMNHKPEDDPAKGPAIAHMSYVYYSVPGSQGPRPITFFYNGGPGSSTVWLHMGSLGPKHVVTADNTPTGPPPYKLADNPYSLLDVSDVVFIDMPGTGFGTLEGKEAGKAFWGVDEDAQAFGRFIARFLGKYDRWNSPKYLFGESYGTTRSAVLANVLTNQKDISLNGVILLSQILYFDTDIDTVTPGNDLPYAVALPTFAATAVYHHKLPEPSGGLEGFLKEVEAFATGPYLSALAQGDLLPASDKQAIAEKLHSYTGLPVDYLLKANLRVSGGEFEHTLLGDEDLSTGRLDARFAGPSMDPLSQTVGYDPGSSAVSGAYIALFNSYARNTLKYGDGLTFQPSAYSQPGFTWDWSRNGQHVDLPTATEVLSDLASAMKQNPYLHVMLNGGYYDLATPFYAAEYEDHHLPIPQKLAGNVEYDFYKSGHMVYLHQDSLHQLHDNVAAFIRRTEQGGPAVR